MNNGYSFDSFKSWIATRYKETISIMPDVVYDPPAIASAIERLALTMWEGNEEKWGDEKWLFMVNHIQESSGVEGDAKLGLVALFDLFLSCLESGRLSGVDEEEQFIKMLPVITRQRSQSDRILLPVMVLLVARVAVGAVKLPNGSGKPYLEQICEQMKSTAASLAIHKDVPSHSSPSSTGSGCLLGVLMLIGVPISLFLMA